MVAFTEATPLTAEDREPQMSSVVFSSPGWNGEADPGVDMLFTSPQISTGRNPCPGNG